MKKSKVNLDMWVDIPSEMRKYLRNYGYHFNGKAYKYAVKHMYKQRSDGKEESIEPIEKEKVDEILKKYSITLDNNEMYDAAYVYAMVMADFFGKSIPNEQYAAMYVKDKIDDVDQPDGYIFNEWYAKMCFAGEPIDWEDLV